MSQNAVHSTQPPKRSKKRYCPKTKTGCLTCRIRRVKCDEAKPDCLKCTKTGRTCDGYFENLPSRATLLDASPRVSLTPASCSNAFERRIFEWFRHRTVPVLCGHFPDETYSRTTLQLYFSEPAIRYTVNAFGALHHELYSTRQARNAGLIQNLRTWFPAQRFSMALQEMQTLLSREQIPLEVVLVCSVLLVQFEGLQQDFVPAMQHAEKALGLLSTGEKKIETSLLRTMMRFDAQSAMHAGRKAPQLASFASDLDRHLPPALTSALEARYLVTSWSSRLYAFSQSVADRHILEPGNVPLEALAQAQELEQVFSRLNQLLAAFQKKQSSKLPMREQHGLRILRARLKILRMFSATCLYSEATIFDAYLDDFKDILKICTDLLTDDRADRRLFVLHIDEGLMHPLYVVATHCRDSHIRCRAFGLLKELPVGNGFRIWHADVVIRTAKLIIGYEEAGLEDLKCSDVPEWRRVHHASFDNWDVESWHTTFGGPLRVRPNGVDGEWMHLHEALDHEFRRYTGKTPLLYAPLNEGVTS